MVVAGQPADVMKECLPWTDYAWALMKREEGAIMEDLWLSPLVNIKWRACSFWTS
jgi:hypothetical protein